MLHFLVLAVISWIAGFLGGLTGTGGIIMPPIMTEFMGYPPHLSMAMAQATYVLPSVMAVSMFLRKKQLDWTVALPMAVPGCLCSFLAAHYIKPKIDPTWLTIVFALCIVISGAVMLRSSGSSARRPLVNPWRTVFLAALGASVGIMAGITGSGSSSVLVPIMVVAGLEVLSVLAACQVFAVLASASGTAGNLLHMNIDFVEVGWMVLIQTFGIWAGVGLAQRTNTSLLKRYVGFVCAIAGFFILGRAIYSLV